MKHSTIIILGVAAFVLQLPMLPAQTPINCWISDTAMSENCNSGICLTTQTTTCTSNCSRCANDKDKECPKGWTPTATPSCGTNAQNQKVCCCTTENCYEPTTVQPTTVTRKLTMPMPMPTTTTTMRPPPPTTTEEAGIRCHDAAVKLGADPPEKVFDCPKWRPGLHVPSNEYPKQCQKVRYVIGKDGGGISEYKCHCNGGIEDACVTIKQENGDEKTICCCDTEGCNRAVVGVRPPPLTLIVASAIFLIGAFTNMLNH